MSSWLSPVFKFFLSAEWIVSDNFQCIYFRGLKYNSWTFYGSSQATVREESVRSVPRWILSAVVLKAIQHFDHITVFFCTNRNDLKNKKQSSVLTGTWIIIRTRNEKAFFFQMSVFTSSMSSMWTCPQGWQDHFILLSFPSTFFNPPILSLFFWPQ